MTKFIDMLVNGLVNYQKEVWSAITPGHHDIFEERYGDMQNHPNFQRIPRFMYFYYVRINENGTLKVDHYEWQEGMPRYLADPAILVTDRAELQKLVLKLARNARRDLVDQDPRPTGRKFKYITWRHVSWIVFVFDEMNWKLLKKPDPTRPEGSSIVFMTDKQGKPSTENHTFFDAVDLDINFTAADVRTGIAFINHMKDANGDELEAPVPPSIGEEFQFNMIARPKFDDGIESEMDVIIDPGGTNMGPPLLP
jgi:hypothetical protein